MTARENAKVFVDSNVLLASYDGRDEVLQAAARDWVKWCWQKRAGRISTQVLNELYEGAVRSFGLTALTAITPAHVRLHVRRLREWQPPHLDRYAVDGAWDLQDRHGLTYWNALIVSSALQQSCTHLLSLELPSYAQGGEIDGIQIISPLSLRPQDLDNA
ncbi:MAG: PIN domain-containing protein [Brachymonas sp.]|nr:PIN domain-containing protein [Brachymonas sp.]